MTCSTPRSVRRESIGDTVIASSTAATAAEPLILVVSGDIYRSVVRHGYDGIDQHAYHPLVRVQIAGNRYPGWIHIAEQTVQHRVAELANYWQPA